MPHVSKEDLLRASDAGRPEVERLAAHLVGCAACRATAASLLQEAPLPARREVPMRTLLELAAFERGAAEERLIARAEFADLRRQTRGAQKERLIRSRACHTPALLDLLLAAVKAARARDESEFLSGLAGLAVQGMDPEVISSALKNDLLATIWTETGNVRRINGEWANAVAAMVRAEDFLAAGTGNPSVKARWLSIGASLKADQGARTEAMASLEECRRIYALRRDWSLVARTLVKMAHVVVDYEPERCLTMLDRARVYLSAEDATLRWLAESIRAEGLIVLGRADEALFAFGQAERLRPFQERPNAKLRSTYTAARLLEALGHFEEAEALFDEALAGDLHESRHKDALLDLVYIVGFHARAGRPERAAAIAVHTCHEIEAQGTVLHEQLRDVLERLIEAARERTLGDQMIQTVDAYLRAHWKFPAPAPPTIADHEASAAPARAPAAGGDALMGPLLARALWSRIRRTSRREQQARVAASSECHTDAFAQLILGELVAAGSRDETEFIASLAVRVAEAMAESGNRTSDFLARVWIEVTNVRRIDAEWSQARAALRQAERHRARGSGDPLLTARIETVTASLFFDQGQRAEALTMLERCLQRYESQMDWPLVARTLVKKAHMLVETEPEHALIVAEEALPLIPVEDAVLRWLAESIRAESLIEMGEVGQALQAFHLAESLRANHPRPDAGLRSNYTAARLLEVLGHLAEAEQLFESVIAEAFEREAYREAFLDLLYLFGLHLRQGAIEKAVGLCHRAIERLDLFDVGHEQLRAVWTELRDAATRRAIRLEALAEVRQFLKVHWKHPAAKPPRFSLY